MKRIEAQRPIVMLLPIIVAACAADASPPYGDVVTMNAGEASSRTGFPPPGTVWRLNERDLQALSPAPIVEPPPPPRLPPPPRPNDPPPYYGPPHYSPFWHGPHWYGPHWYWGPSFHYWRRW